VIALGIAVELTGVMNADIVRQNMLSLVPEKTRALNAKAYDLGLKVAKDAKQK
ncbi:MAG: 2-oxoglutarate:acceptor oxidoreductase, partial [Campylobacter sp.]|nr:2-oxoglutarate:acceptor oxidoreductase [Campylobacter sp.]